MLREYRALIGWSLACGGVAGALGAAWLGLAGGRGLPPGAVVGLALASAGITTLLEKAIRRRGIRRTLTRRRAHARPTPTNTGRKAV
jgi:hypothetical protein